MNPGILYRRLHFDHLWMLLISLVTAFDIYCTPLTWSLICIAIGIGILDMLYLLACLIWFTYWHAWYAFGMLYPLAYLIFFTNWHAWYALPICILDYKTHSFNGHDNTSKLFLSTNWQFFVISGPTSYPAEGSCRSSGTRASWGTALGWSGSGCFRL